MLTFEEWNQAILESKPGISLEILEKVFKDTDINDDEFIDLDEFKIGIESA